MLIQQIIKQQTISILDKILAYQQANNSSNNTQNKNRKYTPDAYAKLFKQKNIINQDQRQMLLILINKYQEVMLCDQDLEQENQQSDNKQSSNNDKNKPRWFDQNQAYVMIKQIKRNILSPPQNLNQNKINKLEEINQDKIELNFKINQQQNGPNNKNKNYSTLNIEDNQQLKPNNTKQTSINNLSKSLKKQNQFISRNINRIKSYSTQNAQSIMNPATLSITQQQSQNSNIIQPISLQQNKISLQISYKLFHIYKLIYPGIVKNSKQLQGLDFQKKEQYKSTLDYHKILQLFNDIGLNLQIQKKLTIMRIVKKHAFNPNFITIEQWVKIYKSIIGTIGINQILLQRLVKIKEEEKRDGKLNIDKNINGNKYLVQIPKPHGHTKGNSVLNDSSASKTKLQPSSYNVRTRKIKTESSISNQQLAKKYHSLLGSNKIDPNDKKALALALNLNQSILSNNKGIKPIIEIGQTKIIGYQKFFSSTINNNTSHNPNQHRPKHKKLLTDVNEVVLKNMRKQLRSQKMIGLDESQKQSSLPVIKQKDFLNNNSKINNNQQQQNKNQFSYLKKAISNKKISKITWQSLFQMKQQTMYHNIVIPEFMNDISSDE